MANFEKWDKEFRNQNLFAFNNDTNALMWLKVRAVCRGKQIQQFLETNSITLSSSKISMQNDWIDHLDILDAVRINQFGRFNNVEEYYASALTGIYVVGIKKESEEHYKVIDILQKNNLSIMLVDNPLLNDHLRVNIGNIDDIDNIRLVQTINGHSSQMPLTSEQQEAVISIFELYSKDSKKKEEIKKSFESEWIKYSNLANLKSWWEKLPYSFSVTSVGKVLAHANAQRCYNNLPSLD